jgi:hypothetical protein
MIPELIDIGGPWKVLPPGIHSATIIELEEFFITNDKRKKLFSGFKKAVVAFLECGCKAVFLDGSFVTSKKIPNDYDVCWDMDGIDESKLDPVFLDFSEKRKRQQIKYYGEFFPIHFFAAGTIFFYDFFQIDRHTGGKKGMIKIDLKKIIETNEVIL